jgi:heptosyltransferase-2
MKHLVILAPNWLGDAVMALPAVADVRRANPGAAITVAARPAVAPLFRFVPGVQDVVTLERRGWAEWGTALRGRGFDAALLLPNSMHAAVMAARAGIPERWGYRTDWRGRLLTRAIAAPSGLHQAAYYQLLTRELGFPSGPCEPRIPAPSEGRQSASALLVEAGLDGSMRFVALAPGAAYGGAKRWPPERFAALATTLAADGVRAVVVGSAADRPTAQEITRLEPRTIDLTGRTDLPTLAGVLAAARTLVTNDSGAMHLAAALGTRVTAVFGPTDERHTRPLGEGHAVLTHDVWCRPCMLRECPLDHRCMRGVDMGAVVDAARKAL